MYKTFITNNLQLYSHVAFIELLPRCMEHFWLHYCHWQHHWCACYWVQGKYWNYDTRHIYCTHV